MTSPSAAASRPSIGRALAQGLLAPVAPRTLGALVHVVVGPFAALVVSLPVAVALVVSLASLPILPVSVLAFAVTLAGSRLAGHVERFRLAALTGVEVASPHAPTSGPLWQRVIAWLRSGATWKELGFHLANLPVAALCSSVAVSIWALGLALALLPAYVAGSPAGEASLLWWEVDPGAEALAAGVIGIVVLFTAPWVTRGLSRLSIGMTQGLLGAEAAALRRRVHDLAASRAEVVVSAEQERRRIERDLHDGAQQRLVALAMTLGMAKEKIDRDPEAARALVDEAHREAKNALVELRDLARGLHPPVLTDRGLKAAVAGLASRAPIPVHVDVEVDHRAPPSIEGIAYFVISETLTNVARHSGAARARVRVAEADATLVVTVDDDGVGGASTERGTGLRGLADRVRAVDGTFRVTSPPGGPTTVRAELPLPTRSET
ncbi:MAG: sensor histidine kinase [Iamia sp.]